MWEYYAVCKLNCQGKIHLPWFFFFLTTISCRCTYVLVLTSEGIEESQRSLGAELIFVWSLDDVSSGEGAAAAAYARLRGRGKGSRRTGKKRADGELVHFGGY